MLAGANASISSASLALGNDGSSGRIAGPLPSRAAASASSNRPPPVPGGSRTACSGREVTDVRLIGGFVHMKRGGEVVDRLARRRELLEPLLRSMRAFAIPLRNRFRGITVREGALVRGPAGWGEFAPFAEYGPAESARWLASAIEAATTGWPAPVRTRIGVNVTVP